MSGGPARGDMGQCQGVEQSARRSRIIGYLRYLGYLSSERKRVALDTR
jgi:hypothetical protein